ncbi:transposase [Streptomyces noursei ATCC 11455]|nr:transposase [Streptomyces noursei ATCC 11455]
MGVPDETEFATKPQLAAAMLQRARDLRIPARWLAGDEVYGGKGLRRRARELGFDYVLTVRADHRVDTPAGRFTVTDLAALVPKRNWMRIRTGHGLKGDRHYDWAMLDIDGDDIPDDQAPGHSVVLVRRHRYTRELSFYRCHSTTSVTLATLVDVVCCRWKVEEDFQLAKGVCGLDQGQTTCWNSWMRWTLISMLAAAVLAVTRAHTVTATTTDSELVPASGRELLRLLQGTGPAPPPTRPRPPPALVRLAPSPPTPSRRSPPQMEQHHRHSNGLTCTNTPSTRNYSCRDRASGSSVSCVQDQESRPGSGSGRVWLAGMVCCKPHSRTRLIYRTITHHGRSHEKKGFREDDFAHLLDTAHQQLRVWLWARGGYFIASL